MKVVILAGGLGSRIREETVSKPKPMIEIGNMPILWHIMQIYSQYGFNEFVIALGYKGETIKQFFLNYFYIRNNLTISLTDGKIKVHDGSKENWNIHLVDTGLKTQTGGRLKKLADWIGNETFMMTYGDGLSNVNIDELLKTHKRNGKLATVTAVRPPSRFGGLEIQGEKVNHFTEKPQIGEGWINGGFFVLEPEVLRYIDDELTPFEKTPLERLAEDNQLAVHCHDGFWQCMDTLRDLEILESFWSKGEVPWQKK